MTSSNSTDKIRELNDAFRTSLRGGRVMLTQGIVGREDQAEILKRVIEFDKFDEANDPHGEHDFGGFEIGRDSILWKIDYYSPDLKSGSEDPGDASFTARVLTILLAEEY